MDHIRRHPRGKGWTWPVKGLACAWIAWSAATTTTRALAQPAAADRPPIEFPEPRFFGSLAGTGRFIRLDQARSDFQVDGRDLTVAVLDTGLHTTHVDFKGRVRAQRNFTADNGGNEDDATDGNGHGTHTSGVILASGDHRGVAPTARIIPVKVLENESGGSFDRIEKGLAWVLENHGRHEIKVVAITLGDAKNYRDDGAISPSLMHIRELIRALREARVAVVAPAGMNYFTCGLQEGMAFPAILRETISVGAVYAEERGERTYADGSKARSVRPGQIAPFSQRLHESTNPDCRTDIFAPCGPITSSGHVNDHGESVSEGGSEAASIVAGAILLMQQYHFRATKEYPSVADLENWLRRGGVPIFDGDDEDDNVPHTKKEYIRLDVYGALSLMQRQLEVRLMK